MTKKMARKYSKNAASADALSILESLVSEFPGLLDDTDVNGADLVDAVSRLLDGNARLTSVLKGE